MGAATDHNNRPGSTLQPALNGKLEKMNREDDMTPASDPNIDHLHELVNEYRDALDVARKLRTKVDAYIQELKRQGYSYPVLEKESGFGRGTVQEIVAKGIDSSY